MKSSSFTFASVIAAIGASLCCLGPTVAVLLGLGTFGLASTFETVRPYLLGVTGFLLAAAFYQTYRTKPAEACVGGACPAPRREKAWLWIGVGIAILFATFPYYSPFLSTHVTTASTSPYSPVPLRSASLRIDGMLCSGCAAAVQSALSHVDGVRSVSVSLEDKMATVEYDPARATLERLQAAVSEAGYKAAIAGLVKE